MERDEERERKREKMNDREIREKTEWGTKKDMLREGGSDVENEER